MAPLSQELVPPSNSGRFNALDDHRVQFTITTNLPMPIEVAVGVELHGQKDDDIFIGYNEFISLSGPETVVVLDTAKADRPLPSGLYDAVVDFYPDWGAKKNPVAAKAPRLHAVRQFHLVGDGGSAAAAKLKDKRQFWVMGHVYTDMPWNRAKFVKRLGKAVRGRSNMSSRIVAYYFAGPDMTILVNSLNNKVTTWVKGNAIVRPNATKQNFETRGLTWPLTVDRGYLGCQGSDVWFETLNGHIYAVNGIARSSYPPIDPVWATDRKTLAQLKGMGVRVEVVPKINIGDLIAEGLRQC